MLSLILGISLAGAGDREEFVRSHSVGLSEGDGVIACHGMGRLAEALGGLVSAVGAAVAEGGAPGVPPLAGIDWNGDTRVLITRRGGAPAGSVDLAFPGTPEEASALLAGLWHTAPTQDGERFSAPGAEGKPDREATLAGGRLSLGAAVSLGRDGAEFRAMSPDYTVAGCLAQIRLSEGDGGSDLTMFLPGQGGAPLWLHLVPATPLPVLARAPVGREIRSDLAPSVVVTSAWALDAALDSLGPSPAASRLNALPDGLRTLVGPGTTLAMYDQSVGGGVALVTPLDPGESVATRVRALRTAGGRPAPRGMLKFGEGKQELFVKVSGRELFAANTVDLVLDVMNGGEHAWQSPDHQERAAEWPIAMSARMPAPFSGQIHGGVRMSAGGLEIYVDADPTAGQAIFATLQLAAGMAPAILQGLKPPSP